MSASPAEAQEIQLTGPLAGAPAVRRLRLHREGRFEVAPGVSFTLLDEYQRTIMPGLRATYHFTDWLGAGVWGGFGFQYTTGLTDELQQKAIDDRQCTSRPFTKACRLPAVSLTRGNRADDQLGKMQWVAAPQISFVPFRGKLAHFASLFVDTDVNFFVGPAFVGVKERKECGTSGNEPCSESFELESRVAIAPTFGLGLNFYPAQFLGFGVEWRGLPYSWNTSGFDNHGAGPNEAFPDNAVDDKDREFHFNSMLTVNVSVQFPLDIKKTD
ncbi:MAG: hypothetical protein IT372_30275 [Polyangiaceae bacterium]|nr:hypothetical protein [Polyangiaceae bacterium]